VIFAPGTTIGGRYELKEQLAKGGMGSVWVARHLQLGTEVAIKFMDPEMLSSPILRARFEREAKAAAQLQHANIVHVHDFGSEGDTPFLVMELLRGESLEDRLQRLVRLPGAAVAPLLVQIARGLRKAHEAGYVHRDLKPGNIFITSNGDEEILKILDFGIAKQINAVVDGGTQSTELVGSPHYMSPEQLQDPRAIDARSDLWSLGVIAYRALTGELPFPGDVVGVVMKHVLIAPLPRASRALSGLPPGVDDFFARAFARDKAQRFQSAGEMTDAFLKLVGGERSSALLSAPDIAPSALGLPGEKDGPLTLSERALDALSVIQRGALNRPWIPIGLLVAVAAIVLVVQLRPPARPDGSPSREPIAPSDSAASQSTIPKGSARLSVSARGGSCVVTINLTNHGPAPVSALVPPGLSRVYCLTQAGTTERKDVSAVEGQTTRVLFDLN
jgi:serine/threonine protein kinase